MRRSVSFRQTEREEKERKKERQSQPNTVRELLAPPVFGMWRQGSHFFEIGHLGHVRRVSLQNETSMVGQRENKVFGLTSVRIDWTSGAPPTLL